MHCSASVLMIQYPLFGFIFLESQLMVCCNIIKNRTWQCSICEVAEELDILANEMKNMRGENFHTSKLILLSDFEDFYSNAQFTKVANFSYNIFLSYLEKWNNTFLPLKVFHWILLKNSPIWEWIQHCWHWPNYYKNVSQIWIFWQI
jgi:hypothetical protein